MGFELGVLVVVVRASWYEAVRGQPGWFEAIPRIETWWAIWADGNQFCYSSSYGRFPGPFETSVKPTGMGSGPGESQLPGVVELGRTQTGEGGRLR